MFFKLLSLFHDCEPDISDEFWIKMYDAHATFISIHNLPLSTTSILQILNIHCRTREDYDVVTKGKSSLHRAASEHIPVINHSLSGISRTSLIFGHQEIKDSKWITLKRQILFFNSNAVHCVFPCPFGSDLLSSFSSSRTDLSMSKIRSVPEMLNRVVHFSIFWFERPT